MFYLDLLIQRRLAELSLPSWGEGSVLDAESLSSFGSRQLFMAGHFEKDQVSGEELYERMGGYSGVMLWEYDCRWQHYQGTGFKLCEDGTAEWVDSAGERLRATVDKGTKLQKRRFAPDQRIHIYVTESGGGTSRRARVVVTERFDRLADPYQSVSVKAAALKELFALKKKERTVLTKFLAEQPYAIKTFRAIAFLASCANDGQDLRDEYYIRNGIGQYNGEQSDDALLVDVEELLMLLDIQNTKVILYLMEEAPEELANRFNPWIDYLSVWAVLHEVDIWRTPRKPYLMLRRWRRCPDDLGACLAKLSTEGELAVLTDGFVEQIQSRGDYEEEAKILLLRLLADGPMDDATLHRILEALFGDGIVGDCAGIVGGLLGGVHGECIREYVSGAFSESFDKGQVPRFVPLWAAIWAYDKSGQGEDPLALAEKYLREEPDGKEAIGALALLSTAERDRYPGGIIRVSGLEGALTRYLSCPASGSYVHAAEACKEWALNGLLDPEVLAEEEIVAAYLAALKDPRLSAAAETLLMLLPADTGIAVEPSVAEDHLSRLDKAFRKGASLDIMKYFRICRNLGCWKERDRLFTGYRRMMEALSRHERRADLGYEERLHPDIYRLFRMTCAEMMKRFEDCFTETSPEALALFRKELPEDEILHRYEQIAQKLRHDPEAFFELRDETAVAEFIAITRQMAYKFENDKDQEALLRLLAERCVITAEDLGSLLIVNFFKFILCRFGLGEKAVRYYLQNRKILDRPYLFWSARIRDETSDREITDLVRSLESPKRLLDALTVACDIGNWDVIDAFRNAADDGLFDADTARKIRTVAASPRRCEYDDIYVKIRICGRLNVDFPKCGETMGLGYYYDDLGVVKYILEERGDWRDKILDCGYRDLLE